MNGRLARNTTSLIKSDDEQASSEESSWKFLKIPRREKLLQLSTEEEEEEEEIVYKQNLMQNGESIIFKDMLFSRTEYREPGLARADQRRLRKKGGKRAPRTHRLVAEVREGIKRFFGRLLS